MAPSVLPSLNSTTSTFEHQYKPVPLSPMREEDEGEDATVVAGSSSSPTAESTTPTNNSTCNYPHLAFLGVLEDGRLTHAMAGLVRSLGSSGEGETEEPGLRT